MGKFTSPLASTQRSRISKAAAVQEAARTALANLLRPLSAFVFDSGLSISEVNFIFRAAAVQSAAVRQLENSDRVNISGIAAVTGIPRGEVSRILNSTRSLTFGTTLGRQNITSGILSAWHCDPDYLTAARRPRDLKIFGSGRTFESLVRTYGQGIPIRAILDELKRAGAIQLLIASQRVRANMLVAIDPHITSKIRDLDAATYDLSLSLLNHSDAAYVEKISGTKVWSGRVSAVRKRFRPNAIALLRELQTKLASKKEKRRPKDIREVVHLSVKIVYKGAHPQIARHSPKRRRNFDRTR